MTAASRRGPRPGARVLLGAALAAAVAACGAGGTEPAVRAVILVDVDTLRADGLSAYGNPRGTSPHFDALAAAGTRFDRAFSQAPYTLPSQVSLMTALYPWQHGVYHESDQLSDEATTLAEAFRNAGWRTAAFVDGGFVKAHFGFDQGFDEFTDLEGQGLARGEEAILAWLRQRDATPFFLWIHTYDVHSPYAPPEPFRARFAALAPEPTPGFEPTSAVLEAIRVSQWQLPLRRLEPNDLAYARALYDGEVAFVDAWFGRFRTALEELGLSAGAVVALVSDHGEEFQEHGSVLHEKLYATVTRVPLVIAAPGGVSGRVEAAPVENLDVMPTLLDLAGLEPPAGLAGRSLAATVLHGSPPAPRPAFGASPFYGRQRGIVDGALHLILGLDDGRLELFDLDADPLEQADLASARSAEVERLRDLMRRRAAATPLRPELGRSAELPDDVAERLRALGYLR